MNLKRHQKISILKIMLIDPNKKLNSEFKDLNSEFSFLLG
jgi:hypothetical protein